MASKEQSLQVERGPRGRFKKGVSGNPKGRKPGSVNTLLKKMRDAAEKVALPRLIAMAEEGDFKAISLICQLGCPKVKPLATAEPIRLTEVTPSGVVDSVLAGNMAPEDGRNLVELLKAKRDTESAEKINQTAGLLLTPDVLSEEEWERAAGNKDYIFTLSARGGWEVKE